MDNRQEPEMALLYRDVFPRVARLVKNQGGDLEQAKDIFHDALIIYLERTSQAGFVITASPAAYIVGTARLLCIHLFKNTRRAVPLEYAEQALAVPEDFYSPVQAREQSILTYLKTAGSKCLELLKAFYYERKGMPDIALQFGFKTSRSATVQKFKCLEKIREEVRKEEGYAEIVA